MASEHRMQYDDGEWSRIVEVDETPGTSDLPPACPVDGLTGSVSPGTTPVQLPGAQRGVDGLRSDCRWCDVHYAIADAVLRLLAARGGTAPTVTEWQMTAAAIAGLDAASPTWRATGNGPSADDLTFLRGALAALGIEVRP